MAASQPENNSLKQEVTLESLGLLFTTMFNRYYLVISVVCVLAVLIAVGVGIIPTWQSISNLRQQIQTNQAEADRLQTKISQLSALTADNSLFASRSAMLDSTLYSYKPFLETLYAISYAADKNQVAVTRFEFTPGFVATQAAEVANSTRNVTDIAQNDLSRNDQYILFEITVNGTIDSVTQFTHDLERVAPVSNIALGTVTQSDNITSANLEVHVYYYNREIAAALAAALPILDESGENAAATLSAFLRPDLSALEQQAVQSGGKNDLFLPYGAYLEMQSIANEGSAEANIEQEVASGITVGE